MIPPLQADHIACQLLKFEQQLKAYEKIHGEELSELWQTLNDCKQAMATLVLTSESPRVENSDVDSLNRLAHGREQKFSPRLEEELFHRT